MTLVRDTSTTDHWVNDAAILDVQPVKWDAQLGVQREPDTEISEENGIVLALRVRYVNPAADQFLFGEDAISFWITLGVADVITDGDGHQTGFRTPFGDRGVI